METFVHPPSTGVATQQWIWQGRVAIRKWKRSLATNLQKKTWQNSGLRLFAELPPVRFQGWNDDDMMMTWWWMESSFVSEGWSNHKSQSPKRNPEIKKLTVQHLTTVHFRSVWTFPLCWNHAKDSGQSWCESCAGWAMSQWRRKRWVLAPLGCGIVLAFVFTSDITWQYLIARKYNWHEIRESLLCHVNVWQFLRFQLLSLLQNHLRSSRSLALKSNFFDLIVVDPSVAEWNAWSTRGNRDTETRKKSRPWGQRHSRRGIHGFLEMVSYQKKQTINAQHRVLIHILLIPYLHVGFWILSYLLMNPEMFVKASSPNKDPAVDWKSVPPTFFNFFFCKFLLRVPERICLCDGSHGYVKNNLYTWARHLDISKTAGCSVRTRHLNPLQTRLGLLHQGSRMGQIITTWRSWGKMGTISTWTQKRPIPHCGFYDFALFNRHVDHVHYTCNILVWFLS